MHYGRYADLYLASIFKLSLSRWSYSYIRYLSSGFPDTSNKEYLPSMRTLYLYSIKLWLPTDQPSTDMDTSDSSSDFPALDPSPSQHSTTLEFTTDDTNPPSFIAFANIASLLLGPPLCLWKLENLHLSFFTLVGKKEKRTGRTGDCHSDFDTSRRHLLH